MLADLKHLLAFNPAAPAYYARPAGLPAADGAPAAPLRMLAIDSGLQPLDDAAPVVHVSFHEAEWETAAR